LSNDYFATKGRGQDVSDNISNNGNSAITTLQSSYQSTYPAFETIDNSNNNTINTSNNSNSNGSDNWNPSESIKMTTLNQEKYLNNNNKSSSITSVNNDINSNDGINEHPLVQSLLDGTISYEEYRKAFESPDISERFQIFKRVSQAHQSDDQKQSNTRESRSSGTNLGISQSMKNVASRAMSAVGEMTHVRPRTWSNDNKMNNNGSSSSTPTNNLNDKNSIYQH
jgi:hypothetical protein